MSTMKATVKGSEKIKPGNLMQYCTDSSGNIIYSDGLPCVELFDGKLIAGVFIERREDKALVQVSNVDEEENKS